MKYKTILETIICPCGKEITKEDMENDNVFWNGVNNPETGEYWSEPWHKKCAKDQEERERENGYRM